MRYALISDIHATATDYKHCGCKYKDPRQAELSHLSYELTGQYCTSETKRFLGTLPFRIELRPNGGHRMASSCSGAIPTPVSSTAMHTPGPVPET